MGMRMRRTLVALLGVIAFAALAPQLASADPASGIVGGTVTNSAQQGIAGVSVELTEVSTGSYYSVSTASDGTYEVDGLPAGSYQVLFVPAGGQNYVYQYYPGRSNAAAAHAVTVTAGQTTAHIDASLATGATISGKVTAGGSPVAGVRAYVRDYGGGYPNYVPITYADTASDGTWSITGLPTGLYQVQFFPTYASNYASEYYNQVTGEDAPTPITLTAGTTTSNIDASLTMAGQISGTVTNGISNAPAQGVRVVALDRSGNQYGFATTDSGGHYTLSHLMPSASYRVEFSPLQGSGLEAEFYPSGAILQGATPVAATLGQTTTGIDETLGQSGSISGTVTDAATGYPLGGESVTLTDDAGHPVYAAYNAVTQADGSYVVNNLPPGAYKVQFAAQGALAFQYYNGANTLRTASSVTVTAGQTATNISAALTRGGTLTGVVTDASSGQGIANGYLQVVDAGGNVVTNGSTDPNGRYQINGLAPGTYYIGVEVYNNGLFQDEFYGGTIGLAGAKPITITAGATSAGIDIAVAPQSPTSPSVSGQSTGTPATTPTTTTPHTPVAVVTQVIPGPPALFGGSVAGVHKGKPVVRFRLRSGPNGAHKLRSFKVKLPAGLSFVGSQLRKGVKVTGGGKVTEKVTGGQLVVTLGSPASTVTVSISAPAVKVTRVPGAHPVRIVVTVIPVNGTGHVLSFIVKNPS